jgi:hypothetical protein
VGRPCGPPTSPPEAASRNLFSHDPVLADDLAQLRDEHAADAPSLLLLQFLARELGSSHLLVLAALRDVDPLPGEPLTALLDQAISAYRELGMETYAAEAAAARRRVLPE